MKEEILKKLEGFSKEEKIDYIKTQLFITDMIDRWTQHDIEYYNILKEILKELQ